MPRWCRIYILHQGSGQDEYPVQLNLYFTQRTQGRRELIILKEAGFPLEFTLNLIQGRNDTLVSISEILIRRLKTILFILF